MAANSTSSATALIERAIRDAPHAEAVAILIDICRTSRSGRRMLERRLLINDDTSQETSAAAVGSSNALSSTGRRRRAESPAGQRVAKRNRYEACKNCARHYDVSSNDVTACRWHSGECCSILGRAQSHADSTKAISSQIMLVMHGWTMTKNVMGGLRIFRTRIPMALSGPAADL